MQEIERKFLILTPPPKDKNRITEEIRQGYFIQENQQIRIRKSIITKNKRKTTKYTQTQKKGSGLVREENEKSISEQEFLTQEKLAKKQALEKTRYHILNEKEDSELNEFHGKCAGLRVLEKEFSSVSEAKKYIPPTRAGPEITEIKEANNSFLAKQGPQKLYKKLGLESQFLKNNLQYTYNNIADHYQQTRKKHRTEGELIQEYIKNTPEQNIKILELGCGSGRLLEQLCTITNKKIKYIGIDFAENLLEYAKKIALPKNITAEFIQTDMTSFLINQKQEVYNMIIGIASFQHIPTPKERLLCIKHCYKTLTYNGTLLLSNRSRSLRFCKKHRKNILHSWIQRMQKKLFTRNDIIIPRTDQGKTLNRYYHFFTISELRTLFLKSGFTNIKTQYTGIQGITNDRKKSKNTLVIGKKSVYY